MMINFDKFIELILDKKRKSKQLLFLGTYGRIVDWWNKTYLELDFYNLLEEFELDGYCEDSKSSKGDDSNLVLLHDFFALDSMKFKLPRIGDYGNYRMGQPYIYIAPEEYFTNLDKFDYKIFLIDFMERLNEIWEKAKALEEKGKQVSPTSDQIQAIGTLFNTEFFQK